MKVLKSMKLKKNYDCQYFIYLNGMFLYPMLQTLRKKEEKDGNA